MFRFPNKNNEISAEIIVKTIWVSTLLALIFSLPSLVLFLGIFYGTGNLIVGASIGFGAHFVTLIFANRISKFLTKIIS
jgi:hypothetical protein